ncbi:MAG: prolipoprotein diacylglyceryl transferase [Chloroflexi bacterium]|nr:prolipoprotein diacylglyceryl transferase [Chloroflexota bacterium]
MLPALIDITPPSVLPGPVPIGLYGIGYAVAIVVLLLVSQAEARRRGLDPSLVTGALVPVAICAVIGARLYHVIDQWLYYRDHLLAIVLPPYSGLGLYGGIAGAVVGIAWYTHRRGIPFWRALDVVVPGTLFAQAIARWGNFFNQELYGPPTDLPWGITIDCLHRVPAYDCTLRPDLPPATTGFHPLFLYESLWNALGGVLALWLARRPGARLRDGDLASFWMIWYGGGRLALETLRAGWEWTVMGVPTAMLIGGVLVGLGLGTIAWRRRASAAPGTGGTAS